MEGGEASPNNCSKGGPSMQLDNLDNVIGVRGNDSSQLIGILQDIQKEYNYLPLIAMMQVSEKLKVPFSRLYSIATFFKAFSLQPRGSISSPSAWARPATCEKRPGSSTRSHALSASRRVRQPPTASSRWRRSTALARAPWDRLRSSTEKTSGT